MLTCQTKYACILHCAIYKDHRTKKKSCTVYSVSFFLYIYAASLLLFSPCYIYTLNVYVCKAVTSIHTYVFKLVHFYAYRQSIMTIVLTLVI